MFFVRLVSRLLYLAVFLGIVNIWLNRKSYIFDPTNLSAIAKRFSIPNSAAGTATVSDIRNALKLVHSDLRQFYSPFVLPASDLKWVKMNHGGGAAVSVCFLHTSITEYLVLVGTALPSTGHFGRYWTNVTFAPIAGTIEVWQDTYSSNAYGPGQSVTIPAGDSAIMHYKPGFWALEYGRGFIPSNIPHILGGVIFQSQDPLLLLYLAEATLKTTAQQIAHLIHNFKSPF